MDQAMGHNLAELQKVVFFNVTNIVIIRWLPRICEYHIFDLFLNLFLLVGKALSGCVYIFCCVFVMHPHIPWHGITFIYNFFYSMALPL